MARGLLDTFLMGCDLFNQGNDQELEKLFDNNIVLVTIDHPLEPFSGRERVTDYLRRKVLRDHPEFHPLQPLAINSVSGKIEGKANWTDDDNGTRTTLPITYSFRFVFHQEDDNWYFASLYGTPD